MKTTVNNRSQFDKWYLRNADQVLFAGWTVDQETPGDIPLYENGHTVFEGGHPILIFVSPAELQSEFTPTIIRAQTHRNIVQIKTLNTPEDKGAQSDLWLAWADGVLGTGSSESVAIEDAKARLNAGHDVDYYQQFRVEAHHWAIKSANVNS